MLWNKAAKEQVSSTAKILVLKLSSKINVYPIWNWRRENKTSERASKSGNEKKCIKHWKSMEYGELAARNSMDEYADQRNHHYKTILELDSKCAV